MFEWKFKLNMSVIPQTCSDEKFINKHQFGYEIKVWLTRKKYLHVSCEQRQVSVCLLVLISFKSLQLILFSVLLFSLFISSQTSQALSYFKGKRFPFFDKLIYLMWSLISKEILVHSFNEKKEIVNYYVQYKSPIKPELKHS